MTREEITQRAETFFEWPTEDKNVVTLTSCILFAEYCVMESKKSPLDLGGRERGKESSCVD